MKINFIVFFLFSVIGYLLSVLGSRLSVITPVYALSWQDYFPPIKLEESKRQPPKTANAPEVVGGLDAYSNTSGQAVKCIKKVKLVKFWEPKEGQVGTDENGNPIMGYVAQDARDLDDQDELSKLPNNGLRNFQSLFAKGEVKNSTQSAQDSFKDMNISGMGAFSRMNSINNLDVERSRYFMDVVQSLQTNLETEDEVAQDVQVAWDCQGTVTELSKNPKNCREITISEILFGLRDQPLYFTDDYTLPPTTFPPETLSFINSYYPGGYQARFGKTFSPLPLDTYLSMYYQLNAPKGNVNTKIRITNFDCYVNGKPDCPVVTLTQLNLPAAAAIAAPQAKTFNKIASINAGPLPNSSNEEYCTSFQDDDTPAIDEPPLATLMLWVHGLFKHLAPGESYRHEEGIEVVVRNDAGLVENSRDVERNLLHIIPADNIEKNKYLDEKFTATTKTSAKYNVVYPTNRSSKIYEGSYVNFLRPASWQNKY